MTWTYNSSLLGTTDADADLMAVRLRIGDTSTGDQQLSDEEIDYLLSAYGGVIAASAEAADTLAAKFARQVDKKVGDLSVDAAQRAEAYRALSVRLRRTMAVTLGQPYAGGISIARKDEVAEDSDRVTPAFSRGMFDDPGNPQPGGEPSTAQWTT